MPWQGSKQLNATHHGWRSQGRSGSAAAAAAAAAAATAARTAGQINAPDAPFAPGKCSVRLLHRGEVDLPSLGAAEVDERVLILVRALELEADGLRIGHPAHAVVVLPLPLGIQPLA